MPNTIGALLGQGQVAEVFAFGDEVIKLYRAGRGKASALHEAATLAQLEGTGLPVPTVHAVGQYDGRWGIVMSRAPARIEPVTPVDLARLHLQLHAIQAPRLASLKHKLADDIARAAPLDPALRTSLLTRLAELPDGDRLCHEDFHPANVMGSVETPIVVDWVDATCGPPEADACRTYLLALHNLAGFAESYLDAYVEASGTARKSILRWLPIVAAARLSEGITAETERLMALANALSS